MIQKILSGAQTGADRAGIDAAIESGIPYGVWIPKMRKAEDGNVPETYTELQELTRGRLPETNRTKRHRFRRNSIIHIWQAVYRICIDDKVCPATLQTISPFNPKII